jgi:hypothetical protein
LSKNDLILKKVEAAKREVAEAEAELEVALRDMDVLPRAEKRTINQVLQDAFEKIRSARTTLSDLENIVVSEGDASSD